MSKWADYLVVAVRYNAGRTHVEAVKACEDKGDSVGAETVMTRSAVVASIARYTFMTAYKENGKYQKGAFVEIVRVNGDPYLRTDANAKASDNLGSLPEF